MAMYLNSTMGGVRPVFLGIPIPLLFVVHLCSDSVVIGEFASSE